MYIRQTSHRTEEPAGVWGCNDRYNGVCRLFVRCSIVLTERTRMTCYETAERLCCEKGGGGEVRGEGGGGGGGGEGGREVKGGGGGGGREVRGGGRRKRREARLVLVQERLVLVQERLVLVQERLVLVQERLVLVQALCNADSLPAENTLTCTDQQPIRAAASRITHRNGGCWVRTLLLPPHLLTPHFTLQSLTSTTLTPHLALHPLAPHLTPTLTPHFAPHPTPHLLTPTPHPHTSSPHLTPTPRPLTPHLTPGCVICSVRHRIFM
ncbi:hypothetical protein FHG87_024474 [Trinorchestia longiramus]|nr:hypothetical protein FHG87_024474 [Trinorchestia longiramus]